MNKIIELLKKGLKKMTKTEVDNNTKNVFFYKGNKDILATEEEKKKEEKIQKELAKVFSASHLSFLLGAGCSADAIPTTKKIKDNIDEKVSAKLKDSIKDYDKKNLEQILEILYSEIFYKENTTDGLKKAEETEKIVQEIKKTIFEACENQEWGKSEGKNNSEYEKVLKNYQTFYKKLMYRENTLSKINIFTTNYDLFNERAMDELGIIYCNGFSGNIHRFFNPMTFHYAYAEQIGLSDQKYNVLDKYIYLYKLHGSVNWVESTTENILFKTEEKQNPTFSNDNVMIYPTPTKKSNSFSSPYSDLFREFQRKLMIGDNVLVVIGYSFADEHINNIIYQALATIPKFKLIIFCHDEIEENNEINKLKEFNDPRIWIINENKENKENEKNIARFDYIAKNLFIEVNEEDEEMTKTVKKHRYNNHDSK